MDSVKNELLERLGSAVWVSTMGANALGVMTHRGLMRGYTKFDPADVERTAARLLTSVHTELLKVLPPQAIERILKDQDAYLSFSLGDGWLDETSLSQEVQLPDQAVRVIAT